MGRFTEGQYKASQPSLYHDDTSNRFLQLINVRVRSLNRSWPQSFLALGRGNTHALCRVNVTLPCYREPVSGIGGAFREFREVLFGFEQFRWDFPEDLPVSGTAGFAVSY